ncbi:MAG TPA: flagellin [Clostridium sp.]|jgi:flagellin|nr:flagellin [Clostridium sp.]
MRLNQNLASLNIYRNQVGNYRKQSVAIHNISSGYKVNSAKENPNNLAKSESMRMQIRGLQMAARNAQDGMSMLNTVDGALGSISSMLQRIKELTVQAGGAANPEAREAIQLEIEELTKGLDDATNNCDFNGVKLIKDEDVTDNNLPTYIKMAGGANVGETVPIPKYNLTSNMLGGAAAGDKLKDIDITTEEGRKKTMSTVDNALEMVTSVRSKYGALQNKFESLYSNIAGIEISIKGAESNLRDADVAYEMMELARANILVEAGNAMMVQSNNFPKEILRILENVK